MSDQLKGALAVSTGQLREHARHLAEAGYEAVTDVELERRRVAGDDVSRLAALSFDDGYVSTTLARDILAEFGFVATVYIVPPAVGNGEPMRWKGVEQWADGPHRDELVALSWAQVESLKESGWEIGAHTLTHPELTKCDDDQLAEELGGSRDAIVARLGECDSIAYPYGLADRRIARAAREAGYVNGTTLPGWIKYDEPMLRPRLGIYDSDSGWRYRVKVSSAMTAVRSLPLLFSRASS